MEWQKIDIDEKVKTPFQLYHNAKDPIISAAYAQLTYDSLKTKGLYHIKEILESSLDQQAGHKFESDSIGRLNSFLREFMPKLALKEPKIPSPPPYNAS